MIFDYILGFGDSLAFSFLGAIPAFGLSSGITTTLPRILEIIMGFDTYLPIVEALQTVLFCVGTTFTLKIIKVVLSIVHVDMNA